MTDGKSIRESIKTAEGRAHRLIAAAQQEAGLALRYAAEQSLKLHGLYGNPAAKTALTIKALQLGTWDCSQSPTRKCAYNPRIDPALDECLYCGGPNERK